MTGKVTIYQEYENTSQVPIEAEYLFPLNDQATVCGFEAFIADKHIIGVCKEKEIAHREYREAIEQGKGAYLIDQETSEIFKVKVGNLPANSRCVIKITYLTELDVQNEQIYFRLPNNLASWQVLEHETSPANEQNSLVLKLINRLNDSQLKERQSFLAFVLMPFQIEYIRSPTHRLNVKKTACQAVVETAGSLSKDDSLLVVIQMATIHVPRMLVEDYYNPNTNRTSRACMVSFYPEFDVQQNNSKQLVINLLVDCSNSMKESNLIEASRLLAVYMIDFLPSDCTFNVTLFGTDYQSLFPIECKLNPANTAKAKNFLRTNTTQTRGNTDLMNVLKTFYEDGESTSTAENRNYVLISDGHLTRPNELFPYLKSNFSSRIFACSVGDSSNNSHLLRQLSRATNASYESFELSHKSKWRSKLVDLFDRVKQPPALTDIHIEWQNMRPATDTGDDVSNVQAPSTIGALFNGRRVVAYAFVDNCQQATLKARMNGYEISTVVTCPELCITQGDLVHKLTAKSLIDDWQYGLLCEHDKIEDQYRRANLKQKIINLSKMYSITCEYTSFVAIEDRKPGEKIATKQVNLQTFLAFTLVLMIMIIIFCYKTLILTHIKTLSIIKNCKM